jgi:tetratricopeptide (TPR) repeat protein
VEKDFTLSTYIKFIKVLIKQNYSIYSLENYLLNKPKEEKRVIILRHDVDKNPKNSERIACIEKELGIKSSFYFRTSRKNKTINIIKKISKKGHEIGYHYEDFSKAKGDYEKAIQSFKKNLCQLRKYYPVKTICMHGSPLSKLDNKDLWKKYNYRDYGIIGEPYFDIDYNEFLYLTDSGRRWNGDKFIIRDKVISKYNFNLKTTFDVIENIPNLPGKLFITTHPQRWNNNIIPWFKELVTQKLKNLVKQRLINHKIPN